MTDPIQIYGLLFEYLAPVVLTILIALAFIFPAIAFGVWIDGKRKNWVYAAAPLLSMAYVFAVTPLALSVIFSFWDWWTA